MMEKEEEMNKYQKILGGWSVPEGKSTEQAWKEIESKLDSIPARETRVIKMNWKPLVGVASAAAVVIMAVVIGWPKSRVVRQMAEAKQTKTIVLPDQSVMTLNASSTAEYAEDWSEKRVLKLEGEAFFEVKKGSNFSVITPSGVVEVLGTSFDVFAREEKFRVECYTGRVRVSAGHGNVEITPGYAAELEKGTLDISTFDSNEGGWRKGEFHLKSEPFMNVVNEIERQYNVRIECNEIPENALPTVYFTRDVTPLEEVLGQLCKPFNLSFEIGANNVVIISKIKN
jgi:transmembrane sensor